MSQPQTPILPHQDILTEFQYGKFVLSNLAAKRAKQIKEGAPPMVQVDSRHPLTIALAEIAAGKVRPGMPREATEALIDDDPYGVTLDDSGVAGDLGILLPALDETEAELVSSLHEDLEPEEEIEDPTQSQTLSDLLGVATEDVDVVTPEGDGEALSLSDIADQETMEEGEETEE